MQTRAVAACCLAAAASAPHDSTAERIPLLTPPHPTTRPPIIPHTQQPHHTHTRHADPRATARDDDKHATSAVQPPRIRLSATRAALCLAALLAVFTANQWSRSIIFYLVDFSSSPTADDAARLFANVDLGFDQAQYGLLASLGFAALFSLASLFAGRVIDSVDARSTLVASTLAWSAAMAAQGMASSFSDLLGSRLALGFSQAFCNPAAYSALSAVYPPQQRATVFGIYSSGVYLGGGLAALSVVLDVTLGWRGLSLTTAAVGACTALGSLALLPPVPPEGKALQAGGDPTASKPGADDATAAAGGLMDDVVELLSIKVVRWILIAATFRFMAGFLIGIWVVPFYRGAFPAEIGARFALLKAAVNGIAGSASAAGGGYLTDRLSQTEPRAQLLLPAAGSLLAIPLWLATLSAGSLGLSLGALFCEYLVAECWFGPTVAALIEGSPPSSRGLAQGLFNTLTLLGNLAPAALGVLLSSSDTSLPLALGISVPSLYALSAAAFVVASTEQAAASETERSE